jgi:hypothetical protein
MASDFLMGLQGQGAYRRNSLTNLQVELPAVVIGGGLIAIDTATELQAYYVAQVEKVLERFERLRRAVPEEAIWNEARTGVLADRLRPGHVGIGSINSPMQCMLKEVCSRCLQRQVDPVTGKEAIVFSCYNQDQPLDCVDFHFLSERLRQSSAVEKLTSLWLDHLFERREVQMV